MGCPFSFQGLLSFSADPNHAIMQSSHQKNTKNSLFAAAPPHFRAAFGAPLAPVTLGPCHEDQSLGPCNYPTGIGSWQILNFLSKNPQLIFIYTHIHMHILVVYLFSCFSIYLSLFLSIFISFYLLVLMYVFNFLMLDLSIYSFLPSFLPSFIHSFIIYHHFLFLNFISILKS